MAEAARRAGQEPQWILALSQEAGVGRRGRPWRSEAGNFTATLLSYPTEDPATVALRSFVTALALYEALEALLGTDADLALKWPNDVVYQGGKLAGILLERSDRHLGVGIGVNLAHTPPRASLEEGALAPKSLAKDAQVNITPEEFLDTLAPAYAKWETQFETYGFDPIRTAWLARAAMLGREITARTSEASYHGKFDTVDGFGNLVLETPQGRKEIAAAEVFF